MTRDRAVRHRVSAVCARRGTRLARTRSRTLYWTSTSRTHVGKVRQHNEDACLDRPDLGLWVVADGMGGHTAGDVASAMIVRRLAAVERDTRLSEAVDQVESQLESVNAELRRLAATRAAATIGSTVAALVARADHAVCAWVGDSRIYRVRDGLLEQVTQDHALVADLLDRGVLTAEQAANHPRSNLVTRAVGAAELLKLDLEIVGLRAGDRFVLCSDGLDKEVRGEEIRDLCQRGGDVAHALVDLALSRGSRDNVTVISVLIHADSPHPEPAARREGEADDEDTIPGFTAGRRSPDHR